MIDQILLRNTCIAAMLSMTSPSYSGDTQESYIENGSRIGGHVGGALGGLAGSAGGPAGSVAGGVVGAEVGSAAGKAIGKGAHEIDTEGTLDDIPVHQYPDYGGADPGW